MKTLVTGATGHLGANLVRRLLRDGAYVRVLLLRDDDYRAVEGLNVERVYGDVRDQAAMREAVRGIDRVYHTAAKVSTLDGSDDEKRLIYETNVLGTRNVLRAAHEAGVKRVVVTSSFSAVGHTESRPSNEEDAFYPYMHHMPYEVSKAWTEHEVMKAVRDGLDAVIAISCAILGPNDFVPSRMGRVVRDFANGAMTAYLPGGFEFVSARDLVEGHILAMEKGRAGHRYIFGTQFVTVDELVEMLERITGVPRPKLRLPAPVMMGIAQAADVVFRLFPKVPRRFTAGAVRILQLQRRADKTKAMTELGYAPTSVEDALREQYAWFYARGEIKNPIARKPAASPEADAAPSKLAPTPIGAVS
jgi:3beta-hydroxysteroid-4beta-carboxylate 3-dehydrogenase (decarboxylating)